MCHGCEATPDDAELRSLNLALPVQRVAVYRRVIPRVWAAVRSADPRSSRQRISGWARCRRRPREQDSEAGARGKPRRAAAHHE